MSLEAIAAGGLIREPDETGELGTCLECGGEMVGRVGAILAPHWAHCDDTDCVAREPGYESSWHRAWKHRLSMRDWRAEVPMGHHRADVVHPNGTVVELQYDYQDARVISERESFYPHLLWMLNGALLLRAVRWIDAHGQDDYPPDPWMVGHLRVDAGSAPSLRVMRRGVLLDMASQKAMEGSPDAGIFYVDHWSAGSSGGVMRCQCIYSGSDAEEAANALDEWFGYMRWAK